MACGDRRNRSRGAETNGHRLKGRICLIRATNRIRRAGCAKCRRPSCSSGINGADLVKVEKRQPAPKTRVVIDFSSIQSGELAAKILGCVSLGCKFTLLYRRFGIERRGCFVTGKQMDRWRLRGTG